MILVTTVPESQKDVPECYICLEELDDNQRRPRILPCGHTFCTMCIDKTIGNGDRTCPRCRRPHYRKYATKLNVNYALEEMIQKLSLKSTEQCKADKDKQKNFLLRETNYYIYSIKVTIEELQKEMIMKESKVNHNQNLLEQKLAELECIRKDIYEDSKIKCSINGTINKLANKIAQLKNTATKLQMPHNNYNLTDISNMSDEIKLITRFHDSQMQEEYFQSHTEKITKPRGGFLGISSVGGSSEGFPIFIGTIFPNSSAMKHGGLKAGDQIITYNGVSFAGRDQDFVRSIIKQSSGLITLEVRYSPIVFDQCREMYRAKLDPDEFYKLF